MLDESKQSFLEIRVRINSWVQISFEYPRILSKKVGIPGYFLLALSVFDRLSSVVTDLALTSHTSIISFPKPTSFCSLFLCLFHLHSLYLVGLKISLRLDYSFPVPTFRWSPAYNVLFLPSVQSLALGLGPHSVLLLAVICLDSNLPHNCAAWITSLTLCLLILKMLIVKLLIS